MKASVVLLGEEEEVEVLEEEEDELGREEGELRLSPTPSPTPRAKATARRATPEMRKILPLEEEGLAILNGGR